MRALVACLAIFAAALVVPLSPLMAQSRIISVPNDETQVNAAIAKARAALPTFFARLGKPMPGDERFAVKIRYDITKNGAGEHIWATEVVDSGDNVVATIDNEPGDIPNLKKGQRVTVPKAHITDWLYWRDGKMQGA